LTLSYLESIRKIRIVKAKSKNSPLTRSFL
jgi:hypothetical protein